MLFSQLAWAGSDIINLKAYRSDKNTLSPQIQINNVLLQDFMSAISFAEKRPLERTANIKLEIKSASVDTKLLTIKDASDGSKIKIRFMNGKYLNYEQWIRYQYGIMALGDYPHLATKLMINGMLAEKEIFKDAVVLEAGCGDGILAVLSSRLGAKHVYAVEKHNGILKVAKETVRLNKAENITFFEDDFIADEFDFKDDPSVLLLNIGAYVTEHLMDMIKKYPSIEHVVLVSENVHAYGGKERLIDLILKIKKIGDIKSSCYLGQPVYYENVFEEGFWNLVVNVKKDKPDMQAAKNKNDDNAENIKDALKTIGFKYADKFPENFTLPINNEYGDLQLLLVIEDGKYAFTLRERFDSRSGKGAVQRRITLSELNPFVGEKQNEIMQGFCKFQIDENEKKSLIGLPYQNKIAIVTGTYQGRGLASAMLSLAVQKSKLQVWRRWRFMIPFLGRVLYTKKWDL